MKSKQNYSRCCVMRTEEVIIKEAFWKDSLQRIEVYLYKGNNPIPFRTVNIQLDGKVTVE